MARAVSNRRKAFNTSLTWLIALIIFFPILWTLLTSFKPESQAINDPPLFFPSSGVAEARDALLEANEAECLAQLALREGLEEGVEPPPVSAEMEGFLADNCTFPIKGSFDFTLDNYREVWNSPRSDYPKALTNSIIIAVGSTLLGVLIAIPAAWSMAFVPSRRTKDILLWMLSTKMLPAVGVLYPLSIIASRRWFPDTDPATGEVIAGTGFQLLDTYGFLIIVLMLINLPIIIWMLYTYFREIPVDILEAARMDGAPLRSEILYVLAPMAVPGIASTILLNVILAWNEAFWTLQLTATNAAPLTQFIASYSSPEGLFFAKLSAASIMAIGPILVLGWFCQKQLVRGLTFGAVK